jgi:transposase
MHRDPEEWRRIRQQVEYGIPKRQVSRETGISRQTIKKMLLNEHPTTYKTRLPRYPKLGPYLVVIDRLLRFESGPEMSRKLAYGDVFKHLRDNEGFTGSYSSVRNYMKSSLPDNEDVWEKSYKLIACLSKDRAIEFIKALSHRDPPVLASRGFRGFVKEAELPRAPPARLARERRRMRRILQKETDDESVCRELNWVSDIEILLHRLHKGGLSDRNRAIVALASHRDIPSRTIRAFLGVSKGYVRKYRNKVDDAGAEALFYPQTKANKKVDNQTLRSAVFSLLHEPPGHHGINRTSWTMSLLCRVLKQKGQQIGPSSVAKMVKGAGYKWRKAKIVLTSNDPQYKDKLAHIRSILSALQPDEAFFSIDEYGPFAIKSKAGRLLVAPGVQPTIPQWQKSRGCLIITAALELSSNQVTHFFSSRKNTGEMIRMMDLLIHRHSSYRKLYLSWDAASWHVSKQLAAHIDAHNSIAAGACKPIVETAPLPAGAQFLNLIESTFSGMARAIIHNSDYTTVDDAKAAIGRYFDERNSHFLEHPKRAGKKIWGNEREPASFSDANNCKDPRYR